MPTNRRPHQASYSCAGCRRPIAHRYPHLKTGAFRVTKTLDEFDRTISSINTATLDYLPSLEWVTARESLCLVGPTGTGKSHLLVALGVAICDEVGFASLCPGPGGPLREGSRPQGRYWYPNLALSTELCISCREAHMDVVEMTPCHVTWVVDSAAGVGLAPSVQVGNAGIPVAALPDEVVHP